MKKNIIILTSGVLAMTGVALAQGASTTVNVTAEVQQQPASITIDTASVEFGLLDPVAAGINRFKSSPLNCSWNAPLGSTWHIEVSTSNSGHFPGIVDPTGAHFLPLKYNHADLGPDDPNDDNNWSGENASFLWVFDSTDDGDGPGSDGFVTTFTEYGLQPDITDLDFVFAIEVADDAFPASYFGVVTFDLVVDSLP